MALFDVRPDERRKVWLLLCHSFCNGVAIAILISVAPALFVEHIGAARLPYSYIVGALVIPLLSWGYLRLSGKLSQRKLLFFNLWFLIGGLLAMRLLCLSGHSRLAAAGMLIWVDVQVLLLALELDTLTGRLFSLRQCKRIFPIVGTGEVLGGILGGLSVPWLAPRLGATNLLWVSMGALAVALGLLQV